MLQINKRIVSTLLTRTKIPSGADFVINPYVGCQHNCLYCYADFMKRFTNHPQPWGSFVDIKICGKPIKPKSLTGKKVLLCSVTDPYMPLEKEIGNTRMILEQLLDSGADVSILTKNALVTRDIDLFKKFADIDIAISMNTLDDEFRKIMEPFASSVADRMNALKTLHENGLHTSMFLSPMFPGITDFKAIIETCRPFTDEFWFENLNLYPTAFAKIMKLIKIRFPNLLELYEQIYAHKDISFWEHLRKEIIDFCNAGKINHIMYFYHKQIKK